MGSLNRGRDGSTLIAVMLTITILMILGMAFLSRKSASYESAVRNREALQALSVAHSGLVDFRRKKAVDRTFPPKRPDGNQQYSYSESLTDLDGQPYGGYSVVVDHSLHKQPFWILRVTCTGYVGAVKNPRATAIVYGELDLSEYDRDDPTKPNPNYRRWAAIREGSSPATP